MTKKAKQQHKQKPVEGRRSENQAKAQFEGIRDMVRALKEANTNEEWDEARTAIREDPLSVEIRPDWHTPGADPGRPLDYTILLCTGGPACQIIGTLNQYHEPDSARIEHQDWFEPWTEYHLNSEEETIVLTYANQFYYGD